MTKHSTDPRKELAKSNGGSGPRRWTARFANTAMRDAFYPRPRRGLATDGERAARYAEFDAEWNRERVAKRTWREWLTDRFAQIRHWRELRAEDRKFAADLAELKEKPEPLVNVTDEQRAELAATIERLTAEKPTHLPNVSAAEYERQYEAGQRLTARRAFRLQLGLDPDTGIDPTTGIDELGRTREQRDGRVEWLNADGSWDRAGWTAAQTWRNTGRKTHPRFRYDVGGWVLVGHDYVHVENWSVIGPNGLSQGGLTADEYIDQILVPRYSQERAESDREAIEHRLQMDAADRAGRFSYTRG